MPLKSLLLQGAWSKRSSELAGLSPRIKKELVTGEGEWWMAYSDFLKIFTSVSACHPVPEGEEHVLQGSWQGSEANPKYKIKLRRSGQLRVALMQKGRRQLRDELHCGRNLPISVTLSRLHGSVEKMVAEAGPLEERTVTLQATLESGSYLLVPRNDRRGESAGYCLRVLGADEVKLLA